MSVCAVHWDASASYCLPAPVHGAFGANLGRGGVAYIVTEQLGIRLLKREIRLSQLSVHARPWNQRQFKPWK